MAASTSLKAEDLKLSAVPLPPDIIDLYHHFGTNEPQPAPHVAVSGLSSDIYARFKLVSDARPAWFPGLESLKSQDKVKYERCVRKGARWFEKWQFLEHEMSRNLDSTEGWKMKHPELSDMYHDVRKKMIKWITAVKPEGDLQADAFVNFLPKEWQLYEKSWNETWILRRIVRVLEVNRGAVLSFAKDLKTHYDLYALWLDCFRHEFIADVDVLNITKVFGQWKRVSGDSGKFVTELNEMFLKEWMSGGELGTQYEAHSPRSYLTRVMTDPDSR